ncbi:MAG: thiosulfohydrolase SoxB, partial [Alphaproteobacteria bacterium]|nr:thiosulfohydrolase SoxB [Alphaproteobacteria bacterium]
LGQVTLLHIADCHAQLLPIHFREPSINLGVGESAGLPPHLVGLDLLRKFSIAPGGAEAFALTHEDFATLAHHYGRLGGMDRLATLINAIRAERPGRVLMLDGGDTWQGSYTALHNQGADMVEVQKALGVDAMTAHWEFTYGDERVKELASSLGFPFLAGNVKDTTWSEDVFDGTARFERGGVKVAVIGQAFPYTPIANPRYMMADWSFGIEEERLAKRVTAARDDGADLVVLLSHNGFDVDRKLVGRVPGIDVILTGHTHDALPAGIEVGRTLLVASGSHGKFLSRLDLDVRDRRVAAYRYRLIPVFAEAIQPDPTMAALVARIRAPHDAMLGRELGRTESLLYRRGNFNGSFDDLICQAMLAERDAEIALSPGFRWGNSLLPGEPITVEDVYNLTAITYPACYRTTMSGAFLKEILEDVADNLFHPDPYYQQGGDMVRVGGLAYTIDPKQKIGRRISDLTHIKSGQPVEATRDYVVTGWASVNQGTEGPPIWDVVMRHVERVKSVTIPENRHVRVVGL